jgi:hypothetical protein
MKVTTVVTTIVGAFAIIGGLYSLDATYARSEQLCKVEQRLDRKILMDEARATQRRQWDILRYHGEEDGRKLREFKELEQQRQMILRELER